MTKDDLNHQQVASLLSKGNYRETLKQLRKSPPSVWRDTSQLRCLRAMGRAAQAVQLALELYKQPLSENDERLRNSEQFNQLRYIAMVLAEHGNAETAVQIIDALCASKPGRDSLHRERAYILNCARDFPQAEDALLEALRLKPDSATACDQLARLYCRSGRVSEGINCYYRAASLRPQTSGFLQRLLYWSNYSHASNMRNQYRLARLWAAQTYREDEFPPAPPPVTSGADGERSEQGIRIGIVSQDLYAHAISFYVKPLLEHLDKSRFSVVAYSDAPAPDSVSNALAQFCNSWVNSNLLTDSELALRIQDDQIDVLIDMNGHRGRSRLGVFARNPAAIQLAWFGYPGTTGLPQIEYRLSDEICDPADVAEVYYSETLVRLPSGSFCYQAPVTSVKPRHRAAADNLVFGSFNDLAKISSQTLDIWAAALAAVPEALLMLKRPQLSNERTQQLLLHELSQRGISRDRVIIKAEETGIEQHLEEYNNIDIALDTTPYNGLTAAIEALWMGVPVVTLSGSSGASRLAASALQRLNMSRYAVSSLSEFVGRVQQLAGDASLRHELRDSLRDTMLNSALMNHSQFADEFGKAIEQLWLTNARRNTPQTTSSSRAPAASSGQSAPLIAANELPARNLIQPGQNT